MQSKKGRGRGGPRPVPIFSVQPSVELLRSKNSFPDTPISAHTIDDLYYIDAVALNACAAAATKTPSTRRPFSLSPSEDNFEPLLVNFIWAEGKRRRALERAIGKDFTVTWDRDLCELLIRRKSEAAYRQLNWEDTCKKNLLKHQDEYDCRNLSVEPQFWDRMDKAAQDEEDLYGEDVAIHSEQRSTLIVIGTEKTVSKVLDQLQPKLQKMKEEEALTSRYVNVRNVHLLDVIEKSERFQNFCQLRRPARFSINRKRQTIDVEAPAKDISDIEEELDDDVSEEFESVEVELKDGLGDYFVTKGFGSLSAKLATICSSVKVVGMDEKRNRLNVVCESESVKSITAVIEKEFVSRSVAATEDGDHEVQEFIRRPMFASFVKKMPGGRDVVLCPSLDEVKSTPLSISISFSVVGGYSDVWIVSFEINQYLQNNVLYTVQDSLPSQAHFRFVKEFRKEELKEIEKRHEAEITFASNHVKLRANKKALLLVREAVRQLVDRIKTKSEKVEKHGLQRYVQSDDFDKDKNIIQSKYSVIVSTSLDVFDYAVEATACPVLRYHGIDCSATEERMRREPKRPLFYGRGRGGRYTRQEMSKPRVPDSFFSSASTPTVTISSASTLTVTIKEGNIADEQADVIVNSTNRSLDLNSALASKALLQVAGTALQKACSDYMKSKGKLSEGGIATTDGYGLPCSKVLHVLCSKSSKALSDLVSSSLEKATSLGATSIAFPALGTGTLGLSDASSAEAIFSGIQKFKSSQTPSSSLKDIRVVIYDRSRIAAFKKEQSRAGSGRSSPAAEPASASALTASHHLPNGCVVSVAEGDVVTATTNVIIIPTDNSLSLGKGVVSSKVLAAAGRNLSLEVSTNYSEGIQWGKMADLAAGHLQCQRIYALACPAKSQSENKATLKDSVLRCILTANQSGYSSVAIPALGTGNLGYSNKESAGAIFDAALEFSSQSSSPSLQNIQVIVFDAERLKDFTTEFNFCLESPAGTRASAKELKAIEPETPELIQIAVVGDQSAAALNDLVTAVNKACIDEEVDGEYPESLDPEFVQKMKSMSKGEDVIFSVKVRGGQPRIFLAGWERDCNRVQKMVLKEFTTEWKKSKEIEKARASKLGHVRWSRYYAEKGFLPYNNQVSVLIEEALEKRETVPLRAGSESFEANPVNRQLTCSSSKEMVVLRREDVVDGVVLPSTWEEHTSDSSQQILLDKSSWEYTGVAKKFEASSGDGQKKIVSIRRIQNLRLYRLYAKEKKEMEEKFTRRGFSQPVERQLWHGTKEEALEHIIERGFNRSLSGINVGQLLGQGVYFAVNASYSVSNKYAVPSAAGQNIFLCKVLIGQYAKGNRELKEPPLLNENGSGVDRYDSLVDNVANPTIFSACHRDNQVYPEYLIVFK